MLYADKNFCLIIRTMSAICVGGAFTSNFCLLSGLEADPFLSMCHNVNRWRGLVLQAVLR